jgi:hypothetical protein
MGDAAYDLWRGVRRTRCRTHGIINPVGTAKSHGAELPAPVVEIQPTDKAFMIGKLPTMAEE